MCAGKRGPPGRAQAPECRSTRHYMRAVGPRLGSSSQAPPAPPCSSLPCLGPSSGISQIAPKKSMVSIAALLSSPSRLLPSLPLSHAQAHAPCGHHGTLKPTRRFTHIWVWNRSRAQQVNAPSVWVCTQTQELLCAPSLVRTLTLARPRPCTPSPVAHPHPFYTLTLAYPDLFMP